MIDNETLTKAALLLCDAVLQMNVDPASKQSARICRELLEAGDAIPPASPMSLVPTTGLDGLSRWHLQVSAQPVQALRFELPQDFDPRLEQGPTGRFALELVPRGSPRSPLPERVTGHSGSTLERAEWKQNL